MTYSNGALKSVSEFLSLFNEHPIEMYVASAEFKKVYSRTYTGTIITKKYPDGWVYKGIEYIAEFRGKKTDSIRDRHLIPQDYNDWYIFPNKSDADAWAATVPVSFDHENVI